MQGGIWIFVEINPSSPTVILVKQQVGGADRLHLLARARLGRAHAEQFDEGFIVQICGQDNSCGLNRGFLFGNRFGANGQGDWVHDRTGHARCIGHGQKRVIHAVAVGQAKADIGCAAGGVHAQFLAQAAHEGKDLMARCGHRANGHDQWVNHDIMGGNAIISRAFYNLLGNGKAHFGVFGNACVIV